MTWLKRFSLGFLLLCLVTLASWFYRIEITTYLTTLWLNNNGIQVDKFEVKTLTHEHSLIEQLSFSISTSNDRFEVKLKQIALNYGSKLLTDSIIHTLFIKKAVVIHHPITTKKTSTHIATPSSIINTLLDAVGQIPSEAVRVDQLSIKSPILPSTLTNGLIIKLNKNKSGIHAGISHPDYLIEIETVTQQGFSFQFIDTKASQSRVELTYQRDQAKLKSRYWLNLNQLSKTKFGGQLSGSLSISLSDYTLVAEGHLKQFNYDLLTVDQGAFHLSLKTEQDFEKIFITNDSMLTINKLEFDQQQILMLNLPIAGLITRIDSNLIYQPDSSQKIKIEQLQQPKVSLNNLSILSNYSVTLRKDTAVFDFFAGFSVELEFAHMHDIKITKSKLTALKDNSIIIPFDGQFLSESGVWQFSVDTISDTDLAIIPQSTALKIKWIDQQNTVFQIIIPGSEIVFDGQSFALGSTSLSVSGNIHEYTIKGFIDPVVLPDTLTLDAVYHINDSILDWKLYSPEQLKLIETDLQINHVFKQLSFPLVLNQGEIKLKVVGQISPAENKLNISFDLSHAQGTLYTAGFNNLNINADFAVWPKWHSNHPAKIRADRLQYGVVLTDLAADLALENSSFGVLPKIQVKTAQAILFDGRWFTQNQRINPNKSNNQLEIQISHLDIKQAIENDQFEGLEVVGRVDGKLMVELSEQGVEVKQGQFLNSGKGTIVYQPKNSTDTPSALTAQVLKALQDFRYHRLAAKTTYNPNGELNLDLHIEGKSPRLDPLRPVHLNIKSQQNILSLLKSLQYTQYLNQSIDNQIQNKLQPTKN